MEFIARPCPAKERGGTGMTAEQKPSAGSVRAFRCPQCGGTINVRALGITITAICGSCGSAIDVANPELRILQAANSHIKMDLDLPLGSRGTLFGCAWEIIGYMERGNSSGSWSEYLLFNPWHGFRFLVEDSGHWSFVKMLRENIQPTDTRRQKVNFDGETYKIYASGSVKVTYVIGEFYWRVKVGDEADTSDYIAPPRMLSREASDQDVIWSVGIYVDPAVIYSAFKVAEAWPAPKGIAPNQPCPAQKNLTRLWGASGAAAVVLLLLQLALHGSNQVLIDSVVQPTFAQRGTPIVTDAFDIPGKSGNLEIAVSSPVNNDWVEVDAELINQDTQNRDEVIQEVSYYQGMDTDGTFWTEGSQSPGIFFGCPGGQIQAVSDNRCGRIRWAQNPGATANYHIKVRQCHGRVQSHSGAHHDRAMADRCFPVCVKFRETQDGGQSLVIGRYIACCARLRSIAPRLRASLPLPSIRAMLRGSLFGQHTHGNPQSGPHGFYAGSPAITSNIEGETLWKSICAQSSSR